MNWKTIKNCGYFHSEDCLTDGVGIRNARAFLNEISEQFIRLSANYYDKVGELPCVYKEMQINSVFIPAIARVADAVLAEQPIERSYINDKKYIGHLDYWVLYGTTVFLIELKHAWLAARSLYMTKKANSEWETALKQLNSISKEEAKKIALGNLNPVKVAMIVLPFYKTLNNKKHNEDGEEVDGEEIIDLINKLKPTPNFISIWNLHDRLKGPFEYENGKQVHPYLALAAYVESVSY